MHLYLPCLGMSQTLQELVWFGLVIIWLSCGWLLKPVHTIPNVSPNTMGYINASCFKIGGKSPCGNKSMGREFNVQHKYMLLLYMLSQTIYVLLAYFDLVDFFFFNWNLIVNEIQQMRINITVLSATRVYDE